MDYLLHICVVCLIYAMLASSLDLLVGHTGILSVAHGAFFGIGAYGAAIAATARGAGFFFSLATGVGFALVMGLLFALPALHARDDAAVLITFSGQMIVSGVLTNATGLTGGPLGIGGIPPPSLWGYVLDYQLGFLLIGILGEALTLGCVLALTRGAHGRVLHAIREDEVLAAAAGKSVAWFKIRVFTVSAALSALAGIMYAYYIGFIDPSSFTVTESILVLSMVILGGAASTRGPLLGAIALVTFPEILRLIGLPSSTAANVRQIVYGISLVILMRLRPAGALGRYQFNR